MPTLLQLIKDYGAAAYNAGVYENEDSSKEKVGLMDKLFKNIEWLIPEEQSNSPDAISVPCPKCVVCEEAANLYCYNCGRKLRR